MTQVKFGVTKKRINSTSQVMTDTTTLDCKLKEICGIHSPVFLVQGLIDTTRWNYCQWHNNYYYINEVIFVTNDILEVHCTLDPLATFKDAIENTYAYIQYGDKQHSLAYIDDPRFGPDHKYDVVERKTVIDMGIDKANWTVIMTVNCCTTLSQNGVLIYAMTMSTFATILNSLSNAVMTDAQSWTQGNFFEAIQNIFIKIACGGGQAMDNIRSIIAVPFAYDSYTGSTVIDTITTVGVGPYRVTLTGGASVKVLAAVSSWGGSQTVNLDRPSMASTYKWLRLPKYCTIQLGHPCGYTEINSNALLEQNTLTVYWDVCPINGDYSIKVTVGQREDETISILSGNVSLDLAYLIASGKTVGGMVLQKEAELAKTIAGMQLLSKTPASTESYSTDKSTPVQTASGNASKYNATEHKEGTITRYSQPSGICGNFRLGGTNPSAGGGSLGGGVTAAFLTSSGKAVYVNVEYYIPSIFDGGVANYEFYCNEYGYPCGQYLKFGDITGYAEAVGASVGTGTVAGIPGANTSDISTINSFLNTGIYIEA